MNFKKTKLLNENERNVRVYTINNESLYLKINNIPIGMKNEFLQLIKINNFEPKETRFLDEENPNKYLDSLLLKFNDLITSRKAKQFLNKYNFCGNILNVSYGEEFENFQELEEKLIFRKKKYLESIEKQKDFPKITKFSKSIKKGMHLKISLKK